MSQISTFNWKEFKIGDLFDIHPTKAYKLNNADIYKTSGDTPVLSNSSLNNGIGGYCGLEPTEEGNIITFSDTTSGADTMFYQANPFIGYAHVQGMYPHDKENFTEEIALFLISVIKQAVGTGFSYSVKFTREIVFNTVIKLPVKEVEEIDWEFMEKYIRAIEKIVIKDVVKYKDEVIATAKKIVQ